MSKCLSHPSLYYMFWGINRAEGVERGGGYIEGTQTANCQQMIRLHWCCLCCFHLVVVRCLIVVVYVVFILLLFIVFLSLSMLSSSRCCSLSSCHCLCCLRLLIVRCLLVVVVVIVRGRIHRGHEAWQLPANDPAPYSAALPLPFLIAGHADTKASITRQKCESQFFS